MKFKIIESELISIYEDEKNERLVEARELFYVLRGNDTKTKFMDWIKEKIVKYEFEENIDYISFSQKNEKPIGGRPTKEYLIKIDVAKEIAMIENNEMGRKIRKYFIEIEKRYQNIVSNPTNIFDFMRLALNQIEANENRLNNVQILTENMVKEVENIKQKIDVIIKNDYCLASDIAEQIGVYSESDFPHSNFIGAIAR